MGGLFGVVSKNDCTMDLFFGTDYHSHLGTSRGGMAVWTGAGFNRSIHNIENTQFRTKFENDLSSMSGNMGIGCISDMEAQPLTIYSHLGHYAITTVGRINNIKELASRAFANKYVHFLEMSKGEINPTEMVSSIIDQEKSFKEGIKKVHESIDGSCSMLILTPEGIYAGRDALGRTPLIVGEKDGAYCISSESCAFPNLGYQLKHELGPGEIVLLTPDGMEKLSPPGDQMKICAFLWVYYGYSSSSYEGMNVESMRYRSGAALARKDNVEVDLVAGVPDSGVAHAIGYSNQSRIPLGRPFIKYTPTWSRSFMPQDQEIRNLVARMKLIPISNLVDNKRILFCDDSIVRGTQLRETAELLYNCNAKEVHMRSACPPLLYGCKYLNFSRSRSELDLAARKAILEIEGNQPTSFDEYTDENTQKHTCMVDCIRKRLNLTSLRYQSLNDMIEAIGLPSDKICTYCWSGKE
ncbi:UNVERIFIED_CONTAM: amidophosphoribosyltransferase [Acetivibrio alkalicellulosi]